MVISFEWHRTAVDLESCSFLLMTSEDTGLGALASPLAGYLGKVQGRASSLEYCPWCTSKGFTYALRSYRINLQESITLCTNPQCLFPLVTQSLEDVLASLDPAKPTSRSKRKNASSVEKEELINPPLKRLRPSKCDDVVPQSVTDTSISPVEHSAGNIVRNGNDPAPKPDGEKVNGYDRDCPVAETEGSLQDKDVFVKDLDDIASSDVFFSPACSASVGHSSEVLLTADEDEPVLSPHRGALGISDNDFRQGGATPEVLSTCSSLGSTQLLSRNEDISSADIKIPSTLHNEHTACTEQKPLPANVSTCKDTGDFNSESEVLSCTSSVESEELLSAPNQLLWKNSDNLCWLDSLLAALVNCKSLRKCKPKDEPQRSAVWRLMRGYEDICAAIQVHQQAGRDGVVMVPSRVLQKANVDLQSLRMSVFKQLQPKLHCKLGQRETPVFAMPLLLTMDSWVEHLYQSTFCWEFKCSECKTCTKERVLKTLPTFTNIVPDWHPRHAVHLAPCNVCHKKDQMRTMMLERLSPVFALHFVEGLPDTDVSTYAFTFKGKRYSVTTVIQYNHQLKHFVTWICNADESWLEYDDLKHPGCQTHEKLQVPAQEMHVVFWEMEDDKEPCACSPSSTLFECPPSENERIPSLDVTADDLLDSTSDQSVLKSLNDTDIVCALSVSEDSSSVMDTTVTAGVDTSIGDVTLHDTFEGLNHSDIITLTLVEVKADSEMQPVNDNQQSQDLSVPCQNDALDSAPDSSSAVGSKMSHRSDVELPTTFSSSDIESGNGSSSDPTFVPGARRGRGKEIGRGKTVSRQKGKKAASSKAAPHTSLPASSELPEATSDKPVGPAAEDNTPLDEITQQASPVSSTDSSTLSTSQKKPTIPPAPLDHKNHWSFLISRHFNQVQKSIGESIPTHTPTNVTQVKPTPPYHSIPNPLNGRQLPARLNPKPQLRTEGSEGLPLKAAESYGAFHAKSSNTQSLLPTAAPLSGKSETFTPIMSNHLTNTTLMSGTSLPTPGAKMYPKISSSNKHGCQSSKIPPGLSKTEVLRYKLLKKLKAKKKKLAKLNKLLGHQGGASLRPDSTHLDSPSTVTSSTYDGSTCHNFLSDLLSPATTASNLSPDSTGFLEMLASGQEGAEQMDCVIGAAGAVLQTNGMTNEPIPEDILDEFLSQAAAQKPTDLETEALDALFMQW